MSRAKVTVEMDGCMRSGSASEFSVSSGAVILVMVTVAPPGMRAHFKRERAVCDW